MPKFKVTYEDGTTVTVEAETAEEAVNLAHDAPPDPSAGNLWRELPAPLRGGLVGGATGALLGGPYGAALGTIGGAAGETAADYAASRGAGLGGQFGAGLAADVAATMLTRNPTRLAMRTAGMAPLQAARPGAANIYSRARRELGEELTPRRMEEAAEFTEDAAGDVVAGARAGMEPVRAEERTLWNRFERAVPESISAPGEPFLPAYHQVEEATEFLRPELRPGVHASLGRRIERLPDPMNPENVYESMPNINLRQVRNIRRSLSEDVRAGALNPEVAERGVQARPYFSAVDEMEDVLAATSPQAAEATSALAAARAATRAKHAMVPRTGAVFRNILGPRSLEEPSKALQRILGSAKPVSEVRSLRSLISKIPDKAARHQAERALRRVAIQRVFGRVAGGTGEIAPRTAGAAAERMGAERQVLTELLGEGAYRRLQRILEDVYKSTRVGTKFAPVVNVALPGAPTGAAMGALAGTALAGGPGAIGGALAGTVLATVGRRYGPHAAREVALEALTDPNTMRKLLRKAGESEGETLARRLVDAMVNRGVLMTTDSLTEEEGS